MLGFEGVSVTLILILCFITLGNHGFALDAQQFAVSALPWSKLGLGVVVAIFSLVGFECATAFGDEAKDPLKSIPRAVWLSLVISGAFFIFVTYTMVTAVRGYATPLDQIDAPLNVHGRSRACPCAAGAYFGGGDDQLLRSCACPASTLAGGSSMRWAGTVCCTLRPATRIRRTRRRMWRSP